MNSAIFPCLFIVKYFDFSATSAGGFDLFYFICTQFQALQSQITSKFDDNFTPYYCCHFEGSVFEGEIFRFLITCQTCLDFKTPRTSTARLL